MLAADEAVMTVVAPPGYGKTTVLAQWAARRGERVVWISCEPAHDDPAALWRAVRRALSRLGPIGAGSGRILTAGRGGVASVPGLVEAFAQLDPPVTIVLDHVETITSDESWSALAEFLLRIPAGWQVAIASREAMPITVARLRVQRRLFEVEVKDLAMAADDAGRLLGAAGVRLPDDAVDDLVQRTEGWPVALYLAALALRSGGAPAEDPGFTGDDRLMSDYLRSELLTLLTPEESDFLIRTSVLDRLSGPLCDAVLAGAGSARMLQELESRNLLVVPLDRRRRWYRYHHLLRDLLRAQLRAQYPEDVAPLNSRAADWHEQNGQLTKAIRYAQAAEDADRVGALVLQAMQPVWASGRVETLRQWMLWLQNRPHTEHYAAIAAHGSLVFALLGQTPESERWAAAAEAMSSDRTLPDGSTVAATVAYLRANLCREGPAVMRADAREALSGLSFNSPYRATMEHLEGVAAALEGDLDAADTLLAHAYDAAVGAQSRPLAALTLAEHFLVLSQRPEGPAAEPLIERAVEIVDADQLDGYWSSALVLAAAARSAAQHGDIPVARHHARRASRLRPLLTYALPVVSVQVLIELARTYLVLVDVAGASAVLDQAAAIVQQRPLLGGLPEQVARLRETVGELTGVAAGASALTTAELRLIPLLPTHLTLREIGDRLFISRHTVKSQVLSLYRKLGVSSRGEAVARIGTLGLHA
jgi:LuxR family maltose regulon positive regulatory protein